MKVKFEHALHLCLLLNNLQIKQRLIIEQLEYEIIQMKTKPKRVKVCLRFPSPDDYAVEQVNQDYLAVTTDVKGKRLISS